jgi:signal transduction histidine kinase
MLTALPVIIERTEQQDLRRAWSNDVAARLDQLLDACHADVIVALPCKESLLGFCTARADHHVDLHDSATASLIALAAHLSASALHRVLTEHNDRHSQLLLRRTDRLRSLEIVAGGFAHEIRNPLTSIKTFVQLAAERREDVRFIQEFSRIAVQDIHRIEQLLQDLFDYAHYHYAASNATNQDINQLVASCVSFIAMKASTQSLHVQSDLADGLPILFVDHQLLKQALINVLLNALDAVQDHGTRIDVRTFPERRPGDISGVCIEVSDDGHGIPAEHIDHIFDPFFTTRHSSSAGEIRGLGLAIAHQIMREHGGDITVESTEPHGSRFRLFLPTGAHHASG